MGYDSGNITGCWFCISKHKTENPHINIYHYRVFCLPLIN